DFAKVRWQAISAKSAHSVGGLRRSPRIRQNSVLFASGPEFWRIRLQARRAQAQKTFPFSFGITLPGDQPELSPGRAERAAGKLGRQDPQTQCKARDADRNPR